MLNVISSITTHELTGREEALGEALSMANRSNRIGLILRRI